MNTINCRAMGLGLTLATCSLTAGNNVEITGVGVTENGRISIDVNGPQGEYFTESISDLSETTWRQACRFYSDGTATSVSEPIDEAAPQKFYRIVTITPPDGTLLTNAYAVELDSSLTLTNIETVFGVTFASGKPDLPDVKALSVAARNTRVYALTIAALAQLAEDIHSSVSPQPSIEEIVTALNLDLASGALNGLNTSGQAIQIGTSGSYLPTYSDQDLLAKVTLAKASISSLYNLSFAGDGNGSFTPAIATSWCNFYWGSGDWQ